MHREIHLDTEKNTKDLFGTTEEEKKIHLGLYYGLFCQMIKLDIKEEMKSTEKLTFLFCDRPGTMSWPLFRKP